MKRGRGERRTRGPLAIHAAKGFPKYARAFTTEPVVYNAVSRDIHSGWPLGMVLATCTLLDCIRTEDCVETGKHGLFTEDTDDFPISSREKAFGDYSAGRWAWLMGDVVQLREPIPAKGALSLWEWSPSVAVQPDR